MGVTEQTIFEQFSYWRAAIGPIAAPRDARGNPAAGPGDSRVTYFAVVCPSGLRSTPRKRVRVQALQGFKSLHHRHRNAQQPDELLGVSLLGSRRA